MPELVTPAGKPVTVPDPAPPRPATDPEQVNRDFSRAMAADDPSAPQPPPRREDTPPKEKPKRAARPRADSKSRTESAPKAKVDTDYTEALAGITTLAWSALAAIPYTTPYAAVVDANQPQLVSALNAAAQNNAQIREQIERLAAGGGGVWAIQLAAVGVNMSMQTLQIMRDPQIRKEATAATQQKFRQFLRAQGVNVEEMQQEAPHEPAPA
jgi:hypothetical protein